MNSEGVDPKIDSRAASGAAIQVRRMRAGDLERVLAIAESLPDATHWPRAAWVAALNPKKGPRRIALVAEEAASGKVAGFAVARLVAGQAELETIAAEAASQRRGVGGQLFSALREELKAAAAGAITLEVRASNQGAQGFYRAHGFAATGRRPGYYADPVEDAVLMELLLG
jgi:ribosomal-protein-alanine acetyltransferase